MNRNLESRIARLEAAATQLRGLRLLIVQDGEDAEAAKKREGIKADDDCIIVKFVDVA
jgi:hypothetical protein